MLQWCDQGWTLWTRYPGLHPTLISSPPALNTSTPAQQYFHELRQDAEVLLEQPAAGFLQQ